MQRFLLALGALDVESKPVTSMSRVGMNAGCLLEAVAGGTSGSKRVYVVRSEAEPQQGRSWSRSWYCATELSVIVLKSFLPSTNLNVCANGRSQYSFVRPGDVADWKRLHSKNCNKQASVSAIMAITPSPHSQLDQQTCPRCKTDVCTIVARDYPMCTACFLKYITSKVRRRMEPFKVHGKDHKPRQMLVALSLGVSSLTLLHILSQQLRKQFGNMGRCGYELHICIMNDTSVFSKSPENETEDDRQRIKNVKELYYDDRENWPMIKSVDYKSTEDVFNAFDPDDEDFRDLIKSCYPEHKLGTTLPAGGLSRYAHFISSLPSPSSRSDLNALLTRRFLIRHARGLLCDTVILGDSTTRLAERTLSATATGRGFSLPWNTADGPTPHGVDFLFPMRDLLRKEIVSFAALVDPPVSDLAKPESTIGVPQASSKEATIDALMKQYFESVEANFPSIVTNVVRTGNRLDAPAADSLEAGYDRRQCQMCALPIAEDMDGLHGWAGSMEDEVGEPGFHCYGCARSLKGRAA